MNAKTMSTRLHLIFLLVATTLLCARAWTPTSSYAINCAHNDIPDKRLLRVANTPATDADDIAFENRTFDGAKLKKITEAGRQKLTTTTKNMVAKVKLKLTSDNQQATDKLFYGLNVDKVKSNLFENVKFQKWTTSVTKSYSENPLAGDMAMVVTLSARYGDETLASMLTAAKEVKSTKNVAEDMIKAQNLKWAQEGKSTEDVFKILKLDDLFDGPSASRWIGYVTKVSDEDPHKMLFLKLSKQYDDEELAKLIQRTKYSTDEIILVDNLETLLFRRWRNTKKSAEDVYKILRLQDDEATNLLSNPALNIWLEYVRVYVKFEDKYQFLIKKLAKHYDDKNLVNFLLATRKSENTVAIGALLLPKLPEYWLKQGKSSDEIATIWKLSNGGLR